MAPLFVDRTRELAALEGFWRSGRAECIPVTGRRRVGKTFLLEQFAAHKRVVYYRCQLRGSAEQIPQLGALVPPDVTHLLFSKSGHTERVQRWAQQVGAILLTPATLLEPFTPA